MSDFFPPQAEDYIPKYVPLHTHTHTQCVLQRHLTNTKKKNNPPRSITLSVFLRFFFQGIFGEAELSDWKVHSLLSLLQVEEHVDER